MKIDLFCECPECVAAGKQVKMAEMVRDGNGQRVIVKDKRHGEVHTLIVSLDKLVATRSE